MVNGISLLALAHHCKSPEKHRCVYVWRGWGVGSVCGGVTPHKLFQMIRDFGTSRGWAPIVPMAVFIEVGLLIDPKEKAPTEILEKQKTGPS